jgi:hypothetical protein
MHTLSWTRFTSRDLVIDDKQAVCPLELGNRPSLGGPGNCQEVCFTPQLELVSTHRDTWSRSTTVFNQAKSVLRKKEGKKLKFRR